MLSRTLPLDQLLDLGLVLLPWCNSRPRFRSRFRDLFHFSPPNLPSTQSLLGLVGQGRGDFLGIFFPRASFLVGQVPLSMLLFAGCCLVSTGRISGGVPVMAGFTFASSFNNLLAELVLVNGSCGLFRMWSPVS